MGFGKPAQRVCAVNGGMRIATTVRSALAADHRASDGHRGRCSLHRLTTSCSSPNLSRNERKMKT